jgi:hypothetical protein
MFWRNALIRILSRELLVGCTNVTNNTRCELTSHDLYYPPPLQRM